MMTERPGAPPESFQPHQNGGVFYYVNTCKTDISAFILCQYCPQQRKIIVPNMKTEVIVIRLTKKERALMDAVKTKPLLSDWMRELALAELNKQKNCNA